MTMANLFIFSEVRRGSVSDFVIKCNMCDLSFTLSTDEPKAKQKGLNVYFVMSL
jgi:hypothetical protein